MISVLKLRFLVFLAYFILHKSHGEEYNSSVTAALLLGDFGCYKSHHVVIRGTKVLAQNEFLQRDEASCERVCMEDEECIAWSYMLGRNMPFLDIPLKFPTLKNFELSMDLQDDDSSCYHIYKSNDVRNLTVHYAFGASFSIKSCEKGYLGCYDQGLRQNYSREGSSPEISADSCLNRCELLNETYSFISINNTCECWRDLKHGKFVEEEFCNFQCSDHMYCNRSVGRIWKTGKYNGNKDCLLGKMTFNLSMQDEYPEQIGLVHCRESCSERHQCMIWHHNGTHCFFLNTYQNISILERLSNTSLSGFGKCMENIGLIYHGTFNQSALELRKFSEIPRKEIILQNNEKVVRFSEPGNITNGYHMLSQVANASLDQEVWLAKDYYKWALMPPHSFELLWNKGENVSVWKPSCPSDYSSLGSFVTENNMSDPQNTKVTCIQQSLLRKVDPEGIIWSEEEQGSSFQIKSVMHNISTISKFTSFVASCPFCSSSTIPSAFTFASIEPDEMDSSVAWAHTTLESSFETKLSSDIRVLKFNVTSRSANRRISFFELQIGFPTEQVTNGPWTVSGLGISRNKLESSRLFRRLKGIALVPPLGVKEIGMFVGKQGDLRQNPKIYEIHMMRLICPDGYAALGDIALINQDKYNNSHYSCIHQNFLTEAEFVNNPLWTPTTMLNMSVWKILPLPCEMVYPKSLFASYNNSQPNTTAYHLKRHRDGQYSLCKGYYNQQNLIRQQANQLRSQWENKKRQDLQRRKSMSEWRGWQRGSRWKLGGHNFQYGTMQQSYNQGQNINYSWGYGNEAGGDYNSALRMGSMRWGTKSKGSSLEYDESSSLIMQQRNRQGHGMTQLSSMRNGAIQNYHNMESSSNGSFLKDESTSIGLQPTHETVLASNEVSDYLAKSYDVAGENYKYEDGLYKTGSSIGGDFESTQKFSSSNLSRIELFNSLEFYQKASDVFLGWGCLIKKDIAILGQLYPPERGYTLWVRCKEVCHLDDNCLSWSFVPESLQQNISSKCHHVFRDTVLTSVSMIYHPGATMELIRCSEGYIGCFQDRDGEDLNDLAHSSQSHSSICIQECKDRGEAYAGLQNGQECRCGGSFGLFRQYDDLDCSTACKAMGEENCGAENKNSLYRTGNVDNEEMCLLGNFWIEVEDKSNMNIHEYSLKSCMRSCQSYDYGTQACALWMHNGTHCILLTKDQLGQSYQFIGHNHAFSGFPECSGDLTGENVDVYGNHMIFESKKTNSSVSMQSLTEQKRSRNRSGFYLWNVMPYLKSENWLMMGQPYSFAMDETNSKKLRIARPLEAKALQFPLSYDIVGEHEDFFFYKPRCPLHYKSLGDVASIGNLSKQDERKFVCVHQNFLVESDIKFILRNISRTDGIDGQLHIGEIYSRSFEGENLSHIAVFDSVMMSTGRKVYTLLKLKGCDNNTSPEDQSSVLSGKEAHSEISPLQTIGSTEQPIENDKAKAVDVLKGWGCFIMRNFVLISTLVSTEDVTGVHYKDICIQRCKMNKECIAWSYILESYDSNANLLEPSKCYHVLADDLIKHLKILYVKDSFMGFTTCSHGYIGCYEDSKFPRDLPVSAITSRSTVKTCQNACSRHQSGYFGLQFGGECWCGNTFGNYGPHADDSKCGRKCYANQNEICGDLNKNSLYRTGYFDGDMCIIGQASLSGDISHFSTFHETSMFECWRGCQNSYNRLQANRCLVWEYNGTHCHRLSQIQITKNGYIQMEQKNFSFIGFAKCNDFPGSIFHHVKEGMEMSLKSISSADIDVTIVNESGNTFSAWSSNLDDVSHDHYKNLGQSAVNSSIFIAKVISGNALLPPDEMHKIWVDHIKTTSHDESHGVHDYATFWHLDCPTGYYGLGDLISPNSSSPSVEEYRCVHSHFVSNATLGSNLWEQPSPDEASIWEINPERESSDADLGFIKTMDLASKPPDDEINVKTLKEVPIYGDEYYYAYLHGRQELETKSVERLQYHTLHAKKKTIHLTKQLLLDEGWFYLGFGTGASYNSQEHDVIIRNIQGKSLVKPAHVSRILSHKRGRFSVWHLHCPEHYWALSDLMKKGREPPLMNNLACVNEDFLVPAFVGNTIWEESSMHNGSRYSLVHVLPKDCSEGEDLGFFTTVEKGNPQTHKLFVLKREPNNTLYTQCTDWIHEDQKKLTKTPELSIKDIVIQGGFQKIHVWVVGHHVVARNGANISDPNLCEEICEKNVECLLWSFAFDEQEACQHVYSNFSSSNITMREKFGAITAKKDKKQDGMGCVFINATLSFRDDESVVKSSISASLCQSICNDNLSAYKKSISCIAWVFNGSHCTHVTSKSWKKKIYIIPKTNYQTGFAKCYDDSNLFVHHQIWENPEKNISTRIMEIKEFPKSKFYIILKNKRDKLNFWRPKNLDGGWKIIGQKMDTGSYNHDSGIFAARNILGNSLTQPESMSKISRIIGYKKHIDQDRGSESNLTTFKLRCSKGYDSLGHISSFETTFNHSKYACIWKEFLTESIPKEKIFSFTTPAGSQVDFHEVKGNLTIKTDFYVASGINQQHEDGIAHSLKNSPGKVYFSYNIEQNPETNTVTTLQTTSTTPALSVTESVETTTYSTHSADEYTTREATTLIMTDSELPPIATTKYSTTPSVRLTSMHKSFFLATKSADEVTQEQYENYDYTGLRHEYENKDDEVEQIQNIADNNDFIGSTASVGKYSGVDNGWGRVIKNHVMIKSKIERKVTQAEYCEYECQDDSLCAGWSGGPFSDQYQCFLMRPSIDGRFEISAVKDAQIKIEKSGNASLCLIGENMEADITAVEKHVESESVWDCKVSCERAEGSECWIWIYRKKQCHLIPITISRLYGKAFNDEYYDTIGFPSCGKEDDSLSQFLHSQANTLERKGQCTDEKELGFLIAFIVSLICFLLLLCYVIHIRRKAKMHEIYSSKEKNSAIGVSGRNVAKAGLHNSEVSNQISRKKKSHRNIFTRSNLPLILSLNLAHDNSVNATNANTFSEVISEEIKSQGVSKESGMINSSLPLQESEVTEAFENPQMGGSREVDPSNTGEYVKFETMLQQSADARRYSNQAITGRTSSIISFKVASPTLYHLQEGSGHHLDLAMQNSSIIKNEALNDQNSDLSEYFESSTDQIRGSRKSSVVSVTHQPKFNSMTRSYMVNEFVEGSSQPMTYNAKVVNSSNHVSDFASNGLNTFAMKYGFIPIDKGSSLENMEEVKEEEEPSDKWSNTA